MKQKTINKMSPQVKQKIEEAEKDYRKLWEEIKPFIRKREAKQYSTAGQWQISTSEVEPEPN